MQLAIKATVDKTDTSDVAIDDITMVDGDCQPCKLLFGNGGFNNYDKQMCMENLQLELIFSMCKLQHKHTITLSNN